MAKKKKAAAKRHVAHAAHHVEEPEEEEEHYEEHEEHDDEPAQEQEHQEDAVMAEPKADATVTALKALVALCEQMGMRDNEVVIAARDALPKEQPKEHSSKA